MKRKTSEENVKTKLSKEPLNSSQKPSCPQIYIDIFTQKLENQS